jgi:mono/diheme cytochrome c family protein
MPQKSREATSMDMVGGNRVKVFLLGAVSALLVSALVGIAVLSSGAVSVSALWDGGAVDDLLAYASRRSIAHHAPEEANPFAGDKAAQAVGLDHYKANCLGCHGAPGLGTSEFAEGLHPPPPKLTTARVREMSDGELFWVISNGIRMTGMPAFSPSHEEDEIWKLTAFVRHLGELTDDEKASLAEGVANEAEHHHGQGTEISGADHEHDVQEKEGMAHKEGAMHDHAADSGASGEAGDKGKAEHDHPADGHATSAPAASASTPDDEIIRAQKPSYPLKACVISGDELGIDGDPIDYVVEGRLVRLCCKACKKDLDKNPAEAFKKIDAAVIEAQMPGYPMDSDPVTGEKLGEGAVNHVYGTRLVRFARDDSVALFLKDPKRYVAIVDKALIESQRPGYPLTTCVVSGKPLGGEMGEPIEYLYGTRLIRFCCKECPAKFEENPTGYLSKLDAASGGNHR